MSRCGERIERLWQLSALADYDAVLVFSPENRRYLSGFSGSSGWVVVSRRDRALWVDFRYQEQALEEAPDFTVLRHGPQPFRDILDWLRANDLWRLAVEEEKVTIADWHRLRALAQEDVHVGTVAGAVAAVRIKKDPEEIQAIRLACAITDRALEQIRSWVRPGVEEAAIARELEFCMRREGADRLAFETIVASGARGSLPHGRASRRPLEAGDLVTIDCGAHRDGYNSDETVTWPVGPRVSEPLRTIYDVVWEAQQQGIQAVRPGVMASAVDQACRSVIEARGYGSAFGHATGHGVGLEVHEAPLLGPRPATDYCLEAGMVVTVEPGIYIPGVGGVRLEDTVLVTESGAERLTRTDKAWRML